MIANRVKPNTIIFRTLMRFLDQMQIPVVTTLRDSQHYVYAGEQGLGLHDLNPARVHPELQQWDALWAWLESRKSFRPAGGGRRRTHLIPAPLARLIRAARVVLPCV